MEHSHLSHIVLCLLIILIHFSIQSCPANTNKAFIKTSCNTTAYRRLCYKSLARRANEIKADPKLLALSALSTTLYAAKYTSRMMKDMSKRHNLNPKEAAVILDCIADVHDLVDELQKSTRELDGVASDSELMIQVSDVRTWVNAALEDEETCLEAFAGKDLKGKVRSRIRRRIKYVAHLTSNALALVNSYAFSKTGSH